MLPDGLENSWSMGEPAPGEVLEDSGC